MNHLPLSHITPNDAGHIPVLAQQVIDLCQPIKNGHIIDATFGAGNHTRLLLEQYHDMRITAFDQDPDAVPRAEKIKQLFADRFHFIPSNFANIQHHITKQESIDGILCDVGVSSFQLDDATRGFSFSHDGALDMRMSKTGLSANDIINQYSDDDITKIIKNYGEERHAKRIAQYICNARQQSPIKTTKALADIISQATAKFYQGKTQQKIHPATKTFQALRIAVNDELNALQKLLQSALHLLKIGGRLIAISFHSLEDRIVKDFINEYAKPKPKANRHLPDMMLPNIEIAQDTLILRNLTKKPLMANDNEVALNKRARSAKLRAAEKINHCNVN